METRNGIVEFQIFLSTLLKLHLSQVQNMYFAEKIKVTKIQHFWAFGSKFINEIILKICPIGHKGSWGLIWLYIFKPTNLIIVYWYWYFS